MRARVLSIIEVGFLPGRTGGEGSDLLGDLDDSESQAGNREGGGVAIWRRCSSANRIKTGEGVTPTGLKMVLGMEPRVAPAAGATLGWII